MRGEETSWSRNIGIDQVQGQDRGQGRGINQGHVQSQGDTIRKVGTARKNEVKRKRNGPDLGKEVRSIKAKKINEGAVEVDRRNVNIFIIIANANVNWSIFNKIVYKILFISNSF